MHFEPNDLLTLKIDLGVSNRNRLSFKSDTTISYTYDSTHVFVGDLRYDYLFAEDQLIIGQDAAADGPQLNQIRIFAP